MARRRIDPCRCAPRLARAAVLGLWLGTLAWASHAWGEEFQGKAVAIADGDTITVLRDRAPAKIRLSGIDSPEGRQAFGTRAKQFTADLAFGKIVTVRVRDHDRYGRLVADVILADGRSLNRELVRAGFAWWYRRYAPGDRELEAAETEARAAKRGLWADPKPVPPWEWREAQREPPAAPAVPHQRPSVAPSSPAPTQAGPIIGNQRSGIYHRPDCPSYGDVSPQNRVPFATPAEAEAAGFRLARNCP